MCHSHNSRAAAAAALATTEPRCSSCYKKAPYHRRKCAVAAATIEAGKTQAMNANANSRASTSSRRSTIVDYSEPPSYDNAVGGGAHAMPTVVAYEGRHVPHGPIGFVVRWGVEKARAKHDEKQFMKDFETRRSLERQGSSSDEAEWTSSGSERSSLSSPTREAFFRDEKH